MPATFLADTIDLGDPWHTPHCGVNGTYAGASYEGQRCCVDKAVALGARCVGDHRGEWALNDCMADHGGFRHNAQVRTVQRVMMTSADVG